MSDRPTPADHRPDLGLRPLEVRAGQPSSNFTEHARATETGRASAQGAAVFSFSVQALGAAAATGTP
jgi:hypothetical protein